MRRRPILLMSLLVVAGALVFAFMRRNGADAIEVSVERASRQAVFRSRVTASGEIVATRYADIGSSIMGKIVALPVAEGDRVNAGQILARIDPVQARAEVDAARALAAAQEAEASAAERQVKAAEADVALAQARAREAELSFARTRELHAQALAPRSDLDAAQAALDTGNAQVDAARASLDRARNAAAAARQRATQARAQTARSRDVLDKTEITAPIDGVVSRLQVREGEMVVIGIQNQPGTTLMTISDLSSMNAEVKVAEADVLRLELSQRAAVTLEAVPEKEFTGAVVEIGTSALPVAGTAAAAREFRVVIRLDQADASLRPGLTCDASVLVSEETNVLTVPLQSVVLRERDTSGQARAGGTPAAPAESAGRERAGVFVVSGDRVRFQPVQPGTIGGLLIAVQGIEEGTPVVSGPFQALSELQDGARVRVRQQAERR